MAVSFRHVSLRCQSLDEDSHPFHRRRFAPDLASPTPDQRPLGTLLICPRTSDRPLDGVVNQAVSVDGPPAAKVRERREFDKTKAVIRAIASGLLRPSQRELPVRFASTSAESRSSLDKPAKAKAKALSWVFQG